MLRKLFILIAPICLTLSVIVWAQGGLNVPERIKAEDDYNKVTALIYKQIDGFQKGDAEQLYSCFDADSFVAYSAHSSQDPNDWTVGSIGPKGIQNYVNGAKNFKANRDKHPEWSSLADVRHVHIKDDHGLAVAKFWITMPDKKVRETSHWTHESVFLVSKITGEWKITGWIGTITRSQEFRRWLPE